MTNMASFLASVAAIVCGASFTGLRSDWHQSRQRCTTFSDRTSDGNTFTWAATPRSVNNLLVRLPPSGIYIWIDLNRPTRRVAGRRLHLPLRLRDAVVLRQEGTPSLPEYRFQGRYEHRYEAIVGVDFGRSHPSRKDRLLAQRALNGIVWPRWTAHSAKRR